MTWESTLTRSLFFPPDLYPLAARAALACRAAPRERTPNPAGLTSAPATPDPLGGHDSARPKRK